jgi:hypothetical protein
MAAPGANVGATRANDFTRQADESEQAAGDCARSRTDPDEAERDAGIYGSEGWGFESLRAHHVSAGQGRFSGVRGALLIAVRPGLSQSLTAEDAGSRSSARVMIAPARRACAPSGRPALGGSNRAVPCGIACMRGSSGRGGEDEADGRRMDAHVLDGF